jgi:hypothetical protein
MSRDRAQTIAAAAAQLVVEDGMEYAQAKRKAARQWAHAAGRGGRRAELPRNEQIEDEVRAYIDIFHADTQPAELRALRQMALDWMRRLAAHRPHLAGAAWRGTATRRSALLIDLYCDDPKSAEIELINQGVDYDSGGAGGHDGESGAVLTVGSHSRELGTLVTIHLLLHDLDDLRGALKPDGQGRAWRGDLAALQRKLAEDTA